MACVEHQNVTMSLPNELLKWANHVAVERGTSLSGLLAQVLEDLTRREDRYLKAKEVIWRCWTSLTWGRKAALQIVECLSSWRVHVPAAEDVLQAIKVHQRYGISFWDAMIICSASALGCRVIWSEDLSAGQHCGVVKVVNPVSC